MIDYGFVFLPRVSGLFTITPKLTSRLGGGLGYKTPTIFTEETERRQFRTVLPISTDANKLEKSYGANFDVNCRANFGEVSFSGNQLFFYTHINNPLLLDNTANSNVFQLISSDGLVNTKGWETNLKLGFKDFKLFVGYTFTDVAQ